MTSSLSICKTFLFFNKCHCLGIQSRPKRKIASCLAIGFTSIEASCSKRYSARMDVSIVHKACIFFLLPDKAGNTYHLRKLQHLDQTIYRSTIISTLTLKDSCKYVLEYKYSHASSNLHMLFTERYTIFGTCKSSTIPTQRSENGLYIFFNTIGTKRHIRGPLRIHHHVLGP